MLPGFLCSNSTGWIAVMHHFIQEIEVGNTVLEGSTGNLPVTLTMGAHCKEAEDCLKLGLVNLVVLIFDSELWPCLLGMVRIIKPILEILGQLAKEKEVMHFILHSP
jgi:hypothetical protein